MIDDYGISGAINIWKVSERKYKVTYPKDGMIFSIDFWFVPVDLNTSSTAREKASGAILMNSNDQYRTENGRITNLIGVPDQILFPEIIERGIRDAASRYATQLEKALGIDLIRRNYK